MLVFLIIICQVSASAGLCYKLRDITVNKAGVNPCSPGAHVPQGRLLMALSYGYLLLLLLLLSRFSYVRLCATP